MNFKALIAEFIGTFALIFVGVGTIAMNNANGGDTGLVGIALAHGFTIAVFASATMAISGGHLNPAVTISLFCARKIDITNTIGYIFVQCSGAIIASALLYLCIPSVLLNSVGMGTPALGEGISISMGLITEIILTFFLMFVIYGTAVDNRAPQVGGLFIGLTVALDILIGGPISGAAMNPARHLGPALLGGGMQHTWLYWVGPIIGSILATVVYKFIYEEKVT